MHSSQDDHIPCFRHNNLLAADLKTPNPGLLNIIVGRHLTSGWDCFHLWQFCFSRINSQRNCQFGYQDADHCCLHLRQHLIGEEVFNCTAWLWVSGWSDSLGFHFAHKTIAFMAFVTLVQSNHICIRLYWLDQ